MELIAGVPPPINLTQTRYEIKIKEFGNYVQLDDYYNPFIKKVRITYQPHLSLFIFLG